MLGVIVNVAAVLVGSAVGLLGRRLLNEKTANAVMQALGLCVIYIGISGALVGEHILITILSLAIGTLIGELLDLDRRVTSLGTWVEQKVNRRKGKHRAIAEGFLSGSMLFCIGAMTIVGSIKSGLTGDHTMLYTKSVMDLISSSLLAATMGIGVLFAAVTVLALQGSIVLCAELVAPLLSQDVFVNEMMCVGSILIAALGMNMLGVTKLKLMNMIPAIFLPLLFCLFL